MAFNPKRDAQRLRVGLLVVAAAVLAVGAVVLAQARLNEWRDHQARFATDHGSGPAPVEIHQQLNCLGQVERCTSCHLGIERTDLGVAEIAQPFRAHPADPAGHLSRAVGCSLCHGGTGRALTSRAAHAPPGGDAPDVRMRRPFLEASCAQCHVPGSVPGTGRLAAGAEAFSLLGCPVCHPLGRGGRGGADYGPDLRAMGSKSLAYLRASLVDPAANFPESSMPSFVRTFRDRPEALDDLLIFLTSLDLPPAAACSIRERIAAWVGAPCADCHAGPGGRAGGRRPHACLYLIERVEQLACGGCHPGQIPEPGPGQGYCPLVLRHRPACGTCHLDQPADPTARPTSVD